MSDADPTKPRAAFSVVQRAAPPAPVAHPTYSAAPAVAHEGSGFTPGIEDSSGRGALGLTVGIVGGYALGHLALVPLLPKAKTTEAVLLMTTVTMVSMVGLGVLGYFLTRKRRK